MPRVREHGEWPRLEVYLPDDEIRRRVKLAAAASRMKVSEYCLEAILERLEQDEEQSWSGTEVVEELRVWQEKVLTELGGQPIPDTAEVIRQLREERADVSAGLC